MIEGVLVCTTVEALVSCWGCNNCDAGFAVELAVDDDLDRSSYGFFPILRSSVGKLEYLIFFLLLLPFVLSLELLLAVPSILDFSAPELEFLGAVIEKPVKRELSKFRGIASSDLLRLRPVSSQLLLPGSGDKAPSYFLFLEPLPGSREVKESVALGDFGEDFDVRLENRF